MGQESRSKMGSAEKIRQLRIAFGFGPKEKVESESESWHNGRKRKRYRRFLGITKAKENFQGGIVTKFVQEQ